MPEAYHESLKPCPFCGSTATLRESPPPHGITWVECCSADCSCRTALMEMKDVSNRPREVWNRRETDRLELADLHNELKDGLLNHEEVAAIDRGADGWGVSRYDHQTVERNYAARLAAALGIK